MENQGEHARRKTDHIRINLEDDVRFPHVTTGLDRYRFVHTALPELDLPAVDLASDLLGKRLALPLLISSMTGGTEEAGRINRRLAQAAQACGLAMGVGSQRTGLEVVQTRPTFRVREVAPDVLLLANLGAVQLNYGYTVDHCRRAVAMIAADALILHLNPLQEAIQADGNWNWAGLLTKIEEVCLALPVPVVVKEVGWGISAPLARRLAEAGVAAIDVAGAGGTSWSQVEMHRAPDEARRRLAAAFADWGIPTATALRVVKESAPAIPIIASGGIRTGIDIAKCLALGASAVGAAAPFLKAAAVSTEAVVAEAEALAAELRIAMFCVGAGTVAALRDAGRLVEVEGGAPWR